MKNEPVAWMWSEDECNMGVCLDQDKQIGKQEFQDYSIPLYTRPVKELTDEEILEELLIPKSEWNSYKAHHCLKQIRAILRKASEK